jgi:hypothetical protein
MLNQADVDRDKQIEYWTGFVSGMIIETVALLGLFWLFVLK